MTVALCCNALYGCVMRGFAYIDHNSYIYQYRPTYNYLLYDCIIVNWFLYNVFFNENYLKDRHRHRFSVHEIKQFQVRYWWGPCVRCTINARWGPHDLNCCPFMSSKLQSQIVLSSPSISVSGLRFIVPFAGCIIERGFVGVVGIANS